MLLAARYLPLRSFILATLIPVSAFCADSANTGRVTRITYTAPEWNTDSRKIDGATIVLRDKSTGKIVQIQLEETEPDSSKFTGQFSVNLGDQLAPEIYVPPQDMRNTDKDNKKLHEMIQNGKLARKPTATVKDPKGHVVIGVFDSVAQAEAGLRALEEEMRLARRHRGKPMAEDLTAEAAKQAADRSQMEAVEKAKAAERERQSKSLTEKERAARRVRALDLYKKGMVYFSKNDFKSAEGNFKEAVALDPENKTYYYSYGISLYRNDKYNEAVVAFKTAKPPSDQAGDHKYYLGLAYFKLKEYENALVQFREVAALPDKSLAASGTFYIGLTNYTQEKYEPAKAAFEKVIDTSVDPNLDKQSETYIDLIAVAMAFQKMRENKFTFNANIGLQYDSNVLLSPDGSTATASNISDMRLGTLFDLQYRPIFTEQQELSPHATINLTNSAKNKAAAADPFIYTLAAPYAYKAKWKSLRQSFTPGYELLYMDPYSTGKKGKEQASRYLTADTMLVMSPTWVSVYTLEYRHDDSTDVSSVGDDDLDSNKMTFRTTQMKVLEKKRTLAPLFSYARNKANGKNKTYGRYDLGVTFSSPFWTDSTWTTGLTYYNQKYADATIPRADSNFTLTAGMSKPIREWVTWGVTATYTKNHSNLDAYTYTKYTVLTSASFTTNF